ncbi:MAG: Steryl-sulfatase [Gammaproteobacteria bacterium]|nr:MAG: Steryl-sulfatase [Gammaproteobacteria bacterium]TND00878.1 MAG: Steryl-sulfatase [Gammaproteobacteria bacterium]
MLAGSTAASPVRVNLTAAGTADWIHWGLSGASSINRKAGVNPRIGNYTSLGAAPARFQAPTGARVAYSWSDGTPTASSSSTTAGLFFTGTGNGYTLNLPADTNTRTLQLYVGGSMAKGELRATLSDGSAAPYVTVIDSPGGVIDRLVTVTYSAATAGQALTVRYVLLDDYGTGNITLSAAALVVQGNSPPLARPDTFTLRANSANLGLDVLTNDRDPDPVDRLSITVVNAPDQGGAAQIVDGGSRITYTPRVGFTGKETFSYIVADGSGESAMALISVMVVPQIVPNVIVILADDLGYQDLGVFGAPDIYTPNLDRMAQEGVRFTDFYAHVTCGPSRAALMTGSYAPRANLSCTQSTNASTGINSNEITVAELLRDKGYATKIIGKWHLGDHPQFLPTRQGFNEFYGFPYSHDMWPFHPLTCPSANEDPRLVAARQRAAITGCDGCGASFCLALGEFPDLPLYSNQNIVAVNPDPGSLTQKFTRNAIQFIHQNRKGPFFLYLPYSAPHVPLSASAKFRGTSSRGLYGDVVQELDWGVGQILETLKRLGIDQNTLVIFTSDNGPWLEYGIDGGSAGPLRGGKKTVWEGGVRVPTIMRWPGYIPAGTVTSRVGHLADVLPTLSAFGGAALPTDRVLDGANIWPLMIGQAGVSSPHEFLMYYLDDTALKFGDQSKNLRAIRWGKWKLLVTMNGLDVVADALYDLETDIGETTDIKSANPGVSALMVAVAQNNNDELRANSRPLGLLNKTVPELYGSTHVPADATVTLSAASVLDWAHWGYSSTSLFSHMANVSRPIGNVLAIGKARITAYNSTTDVTRGTFSWSGGTPVSAATDTKGYLQTTGKDGAGFEVRLPADAESRTLKIYLGVFRARGRLEARLSDNSAPPFVTFIDNPGAADNRIAMFNYRAAANGAQLIIRYVIDDNYASINAAAGRISLSAMTVTRNP